MKKTWCKLLAIALTASMLFSACGGNQGDSGDNKSADTKTEQQTEQKTEQKTEEKKETADKKELTDLVITKLSSAEIETFDILYSQSFSDFTFLTNLTDPLLEVDTKGKIVPCLADEWGTEDNGMNWTFHTRDVV